MSRPIKAGRRSKKSSRPSKVKAFGNLDTEQKYPITQDAIDAERYVLLHYSHVKETDPNNPQKPLDTGIIDPRTYSFGIYTEATYDEYIREDEREGKVNTFNKIKDKYIVLHDPTLEDDDQDDDFENDDFVNSDNDLFKIESDQSDPVKLSKEQLLAQLAELEESEADEDSQDDQNEDVDSDLMQNTKANLLEMLNKTAATDEELKFAGTPSTKKAEIIDLLNKYKTA